MGRTCAVVAAVLMCLALGAEVVDAASKTPLRYNISWDSGAEAARAGRGRVVPIPLWKTTSTMTAVKYGTPGFPSKAVARASHGEANFFYCGANTARSEARQRIRIYGRNRRIDRGGLSLKLTVRIGSNTNDGDAGRMVIRYLDRAGHVIGKFQTQTVSATGGLMPRIKTFAALPPRTRALQVALKGSGTAGTSCDVFFDNVSVKLVPVVP